MDYTKDVPGYHMDIICTTYLSTYGDCAEMAARNYCTATSVAVHILMVFLSVHGLNPNRNIPSVFPVLFIRYFHRRDVI